MADNLAPPQAKPAVSEAAAAAPESFDPSKSPAVNGAPFHPPSLPRQSESGIRSSLHDLPPEIRHWTEDYQPLGKVFTRASQEAFNSLHDLVADLAKLPEVPHLNGASSHANSQVASAAGAQRRLRWLDFANSQRQRFIKLLVISQWSRRIQDVQTLVDVNLWLLEQQNGFNEAETRLAKLRWDMNDARLHSPDIKTALEMLRTGTISNMSLFGYTPEPPLSSSETLKTLQNLNILLHVRLNLHEGIPTRFREYRIHSGRVTFSIPHEFEVDLSIADEDPSSQFWFVDFRMTFTHISKQTAAQLRGPLERHVNTVLAQEGLSGCYEFLHEFTLTHKLNALRKQAVALSRKSWPGSLRIESMHRCLVVSYWVNRPGRRNWIQVGIRSGDARGADGTPAKGYSHLFVKCMPKGRDAPDADFSVPDSQLDFEALLRKATAHHIRSIFNRIESQYAALDNSRALTALPVDAEVDHETHTLELPLTSGNRASVTMEQTLGNYILQPVSAVSDRYQSVLNSPKDPVDDPFPIIERWRASLAQNRAEQLAINDRFIPRSIPGLSLEVLKDVMGRNIARASFFERESWADSGWFVCATVDSFALQWWLLLFTYRGRSPTVAFHAPLTELQSLYERSAYPRMSPADIERIVLAQITINSLSRFLELRGVGASSEVRVTSSSSVAAMLRFDAQSLLGDVGAAVPSGELSSALSDKNISLAMHNVDSDRAENGRPLVNYTAKGHLDRSKVRPALLSQLAAPDLSVDSRGRFSLKLRAELASADVISQLQSRLHSLQRLSFFLVMLSKYKMESRSISESQISFEYCKKPQLSATVTFGAEEGGKTALALAPAGTNPQNRILGYLRAALNSAGNASPGEACDRFFGILGSTLPAILAFELIESKDLAASQVKVDAHDARSYVIKYLRVQRVFRVMLSHRKEKPLWRILEATLPASTRTDLEGKEGVDERIKALFSRSGDAWHGRIDGIVAEPKGIQAAILELDKVMKDCESLVKKVQPSAPASKPRVNGQQAPQGNAQNTQKKGGAAAPKKQTKNPQQAQQARMPNGMGKGANNSNPVVID